MKYQLSRDLVGDYILFKRGQIGHKRFQTPSVNLGGALEPHHVLEKIGTVDQDFRGAVLRELGVTDLLGGGE